MNYVKKGYVKDKNKLKTYLYDIILSLTFRFVKYIIVIGGIT